jgi:radical SAM superfamily enzyme YgiQ (UPF0313 family)
MPEIVLATLNAKYPHCAFGLRYLHANLGPLTDRAVLREFTIQQPPLEIVERLLADAPRIVGLGCYIWNVPETAAVVALLRQLRPDLVVVLGGPEVSYEIELQPWLQSVDYVITGEADLAFRELCERVLNEAAERVDAAIRPQVIHAAVPNLAEVALPYELYTAEDLAHRVLYVEASRGCPFTCEFCLSALEIPVRQFPLETFLAAMQRLLDRGARTFKFVDRTFNLNLRVSRAILEFFHERYVPGLFLHFEMIPDRFPAALKALAASFPPGVIQFEVGVQTFNADVSTRIARVQDNAAVEENLRWLRVATGVHVHADLIVGLPGEDRASFAAGFDRLVALGPQEIQVGMLKRLRGTPIVRHAAAEQMLYASHPPYEILQTKSLSFAEVQSLRRFAKTWDLLANSGNFVETTPRFWQAGSPFAAIADFSTWLWETTGKSSGIALPRLVELVFRYLTEHQHQPATELAPLLLRDYWRGGRSDVPRALRPYSDQRADGGTASAAHGSDHSETPVSDTQRMQILAESRT